MVKVFITKDISEDGLLKAYHALNKVAHGNVAVKISTGEPGGHHFLSPKLIKPLIDKVSGTIVECNTAYEGRRNETNEHKKAIREHGFYDIASVDIMDENGSMSIPVRCV